MNLNELKKYCKNDQILEEADPDINLATNYGEFLDGLKKNGFSFLVINDQEIRITKGEYFVIEASVSYNEPKIYFHYPNSLDPDGYNNKHVRVLDSGRGAAGYITEVASVFQAMEPLLNKIAHYYEG